MAQCVYCNEATSLFNNGIPVCVSCVTARERGEKLEINSPPVKKPASPERGNLSRVATEAYY